MSDRTSDQDHEAPESYLSCSDDDDNGDAAENDDAVDAVVAGEAAAGAATAAAAEEAEKAEARAISAAIAPLLPPSQPRFGGGSHARFSAPVPGPSPVPTPARLAALVCARDRWPELADCATVVPLTALRSTQAVPAPHSNETGAGVIGVPAPVLAAARGYEAYYAALHPHRRLMWAVDARSTCVVTARFPLGASLETVPFFTLIFGSWNDCS
jgi:hypothetical protein